MALQYRTFSDKSEVRQSELKKHAGAIKPFMDLTEQFQPQKIETELCMDLEEQSKIFILDNREHTYYHHEHIFNLAQPVNRERPQTICASCGYDVKGGPYFCTFCGDQTNETCLKKTRLYPEGPPDPETGKKTLRGRICKVCDYKFILRESVKDAYKMIGSSKEEMAANLRKI